MSLKPTTRLLLKHAHGNNKTGPIRRLQRHASTFAGRGNAYDYATGPDVMAARKRVAGRIRQARKALGSSAHRKRTLGDIARLGSKAD